MSSILSSRTSILKNYAQTSREHVKQAATNKVRFDLLKDSNLRTVLEDAISKVNLKAYDDYLGMIKDEQISETDFMAAIQESREVIDLLKPKFFIFVEALISMNWTKKSEAAILEYHKFLIDLLSAHNRYTQFAIKKLILYWIPHDGQEELWNSGIPSVDVRDCLLHVHKTIGAILDVIPLSHELIVKTIDAYFPYYKKASFKIAGYVHNIFWLLDYRPHLQDDLLKILFKK